MHQGSNCGRMRKFISAGFVNYRSGLWACRSHVSGPTQPYFPPAFSPVAFPFFCPLLSLLLSHAHGSGGRCGPSGRRTGVLHGLGRQLCSSAGLSASLSFLQIAFWTDLLHIFMDRHLTGKCPWERRYSGTAGPKTALCNRPYSHWSRSFPLLFTEGYRNGHWDSLECDRPYRSWSGDHGPNLN